MVFPLKNHVGMFKLLCEMQPNQFKSCIEQISIGWFLKTPPLPRKHPPIADLKTGPFHDHPHLSTHPFHDPKSIGPTPWSCRIYTCWVAIVFLGKDNRWNYEEDGYYPSSHMLNFGGVVDILFLLYRCCAEHAQCMQFFAVWYKIYTSVYIYILTQFYNAYTMQTAYELQAT